MAINLQDSTVSYGFQSQQQQAVHIRITREVKEALARARSNGQTATLEVPEAGAGLVIRVGDQRFETHPPSDQQRLHVFTQSKKGCTEIAQVQQRAVVKRSSLITGPNQSGVSLAPSNTLMQPSLQAAPRPSAGLVQNGRHKPPGKPHLQNGSLEPQAVLRPAGQQRPRAPPVPLVPHAPAPGITSSSRQPDVSQPAHLRPPPPASGSHPSSGPSMHPACNRLEPVQQTALPAAQVSSQNASAGGSNQSAQTTAPKDLKGKAGHAKAPAAAGAGVAPDVLQKVCAIAAREEKPNQPVMLAALLLCKPATPKNINALMVEVEKKVRSFQRMQGQALKNIYDRLSDFRPGGTRQLKAAFVEEAEQILRSLEQAETTAGRKASDGKPSPPPPALHHPQPDSIAQGRKQSVERQAAPDRRRTPTPEPRSMHGDQPADQGRKKKKKKLTKAADLAEGAQGMDIDRPVAGSKRKMQVVGLTQRNSDDEAAPSARAAKVQKSSHQHAASPSPIAAAQQHQPAALNGSHPRAGSLGPEGTLHRQDAPVSDSGNAQAGAPQLPGPKIKLKITGRWSAGSDNYDDSWFAQHVDRQPELRAPVSDLLQFEEMVREYDSKHGIYFRLHQEIQDLRMKVEGLQQAIHKASTEADKVKYQDQFKLMWNRRQPHSRRWDKAFEVLHAELEVMHEHLQAFYDRHQ